MFISFTNRVFIKHKASQGHKSPKAESARSSICKEVVRGGSITSQNIYRNALYSLERQPKAVGVNDEEWVLKSLYPLAGTVGGGLV